MKRAFNFFNVCLTGNSGKFLLLQIIVCMLLCSTNSYALDLPIELQPYQHEAVLFGYNPDYVVNVPAFDGMNRPYIRSRSGDPCDTGYIHTLHDGQWVQKSFLGAVQDKYPDFVRFEKVWGYEGGRIVFDAEDDMYTKMIVVRTGDVYNNILVYSTDYGDTFQVYELPGGTYDMEHWVGHNALNRPPLLCNFNTDSSHPDVPSGNQSIGVIQMVKQNGLLVLNPRLEVTDKGLYLSRHSGHSSFAVSAEDKTFIVWAETTTDPQAPGSPTYVAEYDPNTNTVSGVQLVAYGEIANDIHNTPGIAIDSQGYLHIITGSESSRFYYTRSNQPYSTAGGFTTPVITYDKGWDEGGTEEGKMAYPSMLIDLDDNVHLVFRNWRTGVDPYHSGNVIAALAYQTKTAQGNWPADAQLMVIPPVSGYSIYYQKLTMDNLGNLFLFYEYLEDEADIYDYPTDYFPALLSSLDGGDSWDLADNTYFESIAVEFVKNGSFETGALPIPTGWGFWGNPADDWGFGTSGTADVIRADGGDGDPWWGRIADDGDVFVALSNPAGDTSWITQQLTGLVIGNTYNVDFAATLGSGENGTSDLEIYIGDTLVYDVSMARYGWYHSGDFGLQKYVANETDGSDPILKLVHVNSDTVSHKMAIDSVSVMGDKNMDCPYAYLVSDINKDCYVDLLDFALLANNWLSCNNANDVGCW